MGGKGWAALESVETARELACVILSVDPSPSLTLAGLDAAVLGDVAVRLGAGTLRHLEGGFPVRAYSCSAFGRVLSRDGAGPVMRGWGLKYRGDWVAVGRFTAPGEAPPGRPYFTFDVEWRVGPSGGDK